jgi:hypothetical protein
LISGVKGDLGNYYLILDSMKGRMNNEKSNELLDILVENMHKFVSAAKPPITLPRQQACELIDSVLMSYEQLNDYILDPNGH